jgi:thioredoxin-related protein
LECRQVIFDLALFYLALFTTCITALANDWNLFFPEFFPFVFILCSISIWISFFSKKNYIYIITLLVLTSYIAGQYIVLPYFYNKYSDLSIHKQKSNLKELQVLDLNNNNVTFKLDNYKLTILTFGFIDCLPCRKYDETLIEDIITPNKMDSNILILKINPFDEPNRIKVSYDSLLINYIYREENEKLTKLFQIEGYPVIILLNSKGQILKRFDGYKPEFKINYLKEVNEIIKQETL